MLWLCSGAAASSLGYSLAAGEQLHADDARKHAQSVHNEDSRRL